MNKKDRLVSCIITTYKRELSILKRAVESIVNQTYGNLEIIIVNDYPENVDLSRQIKKYIESINDSRLFYIVHDKNYGACKARNTGILASHGEYIGFLDDDDEWVKDKIEKQLLEFSSSKIGVVYCYFNNISINNDVQKIIPCKINGNIFNELLRGNCVGGTSMPLIRREVFDVVGLFDEKLLSSQDHDLWLRIASVYEFVCSNFYLVNRFMQYESITFNITKQKHGFYYFIKKHIEFYQKDRSAYNFILNQKVYQWISTGNFNAALECYKRALRIKPYSIYNLIKPLKGLLYYIINNLNL